MQTFESEKNLCSSVGENTGLSRRGSWVRVPSAPPFSIEATELFLISRSTLGVKVERKRAESGQK